MWEGFKVPYLCLSLFTDWEKNSQQRREWRAENISMGGGVPETAGPENLLHAKTWAHISLWPQATGREKTQAELTLPDAFPQTSFMFLTSGLSPMAPHSHPLPQQPTAFLGFLHRVWVHDRNTERIEMGCRGGGEGKVGRGSDVYSSYTWISAQSWGVQFTCFSITWLILRVIPPAVAEV